MLIFSYLQNSDCYRNFGNITASLCLPWLINPKYILRYLFLSFFLKFSLHIVDFIHKLLLFGLQLFILFIKVHSFLFKHLDFIFDFRYWFVQVIFNFFALINLFLNTIIYSFLNFNDCIFETLDTLLYFFFLFENIHLVSANLINHKFYFFIFHF